VASPTPALVLLETPRSKEELLDGLAAGLGFPGWFGRNWDALEKTLGAAEPGLAGPVVIVWDGSAALAAVDRRSWTTAREVFRHGSAGRPTRGAGRLSCSSPGSFRPVTREVSR
jgi:hypothetical protein